MHIGKEKPGLPYYINGTEIAMVELEKDIGFWIANHISTSTHVHKARNKALAEIARIKRNFSYIDKRALEAVQSKVTAMVYGIRHGNADARRKMLSLKQRRERGNLIEVFNILKGLTRIDLTNFWEVRDARNGARLVKELATNGRKQRQPFFSYRIIQKWNLLPVVLKTAPSLACF